MGDQIQPESPNTSDEIDLGQLLQLIRKGFNGLFKGFLRVFLYLRKNMIKLGALILIGLAIGMALNTFVPKKLKTDVIVKPNFESKDYLYDVAEEIQANIISKDTLFFSNLNIDVNALKSFGIEVQPIEELMVDKEQAAEQNDYLEILQNYKDNDFVLDIIKSEILKKSVTTHRITFTHKNPVKGDEYTMKIMDYINSNPYFNQLREIYTKNAKARIAQNETLIKQIDELVSNYSKGLADRESKGSQGMVLLEGENGLNIASLFSLKNRLVKEIEVKQVEMAEQQNAISIINFGKTQLSKKPLLTKNIVLLPMILVGLFFLLSFISYLNKKTGEL